MVFPLTDCAREPYAGLQRWCSAVQCVASDRIASPCMGRRAVPCSLARVPCLASPGLAWPLRKRTRLRLVHFLRAEFIHTAVQLASMPINDASQQLIAIGLHFQLHSGAQSSLRLKPACRWWLQSRATDAHSQPPTATISACLPLDRPRPPRLLHAFQALHQPRPLSLPVDSSSRAPPALALAFAQSCISHASLPDAFTQLLSATRFQTLPRQEHDRSHTTHHLQPAEAFFSFTLTTSSASIAHPFESDSNFVPTFSLQQSSCAISLLNAEPVSAPYTKKPLPSTQVQLTGGDRAAR